eukprot:TRINITY_DN6681_c0_g1_i5.p1 TRINITY_DN6681_c0_g1~~TRINITY_DN6681_c0_g1_i5.p1  ORF type:complete len:690 (-),score=145.68 TRINITY_DN6681_c0_g1_i5:31-2100(-)
MITLEQLKERFSFEDKVLIHKADNEELFKATVLQPDAIPTNAREVYIKKFSNVSLPSSNPITFLQEYNILMDALLRWKSVNSDLVSKLFSYCIQPYAEQPPDADDIIAEVFIIGEYFPGHILSKDTENLEQWDEEHLIKFTRFLIDVLKSLKKSNVTHGHIKPQNIHRNANFEFKLTNFLQPKFAAKKVAPKRISPSARIDSHVSPRMIAGLEVSLKDRVSNDFHCACLTLLQIACKLHGTLLKSLRDKFLNIDRPKLVSQLGTVKARFPRIGEQISEIILMLLDEHSLEEISAKVDALQGGSPTQEVPAQKWSLGTRLDSLNELKINLSEVDLEAVTQEIQRKGQLSKLAIDFAFSSQIGQDLQISKKIFNHQQSVSQLELSLDCCKPFDQPACDSLCDVLILPSKLRTISLSFALCVAIPESRFEQIFRSLRSHTGLTKLDLNLVGCENLTSNGIKSLCSVLSTFQHLAVLNLNLSRCFGLNDEAAERLSETIANLRYLGILRIDLSSSVKSRTFFSSMARILKGNSNLFNLKLSYTESEFSEDDFKIFATSLENLNQLQSIHLDFTRSNLNDNSVIELASQLKGLNLSEIILSFSRCENLTTIGFVCIVNELQVLASIRALALELDECTQVQDIPYEAVTQYITNLKNLKNLKISLRGIAPPNTEHVREFRNALAYLAVLSIDVQQ